MNQIIKRQSPLLAVFSLLLPAAALAQPEAPAQEPTQQPAPPSSVQETPPVAPTNEASEPSSNIEPVPENTENAESDWAAAPTGAQANQEPARKMDLSMPPPPPPRVRQARVHNGFYLRGSFGGGGLWPRVNDRSDSVTHFDLSGGSFSLNFDAMVGASPADGFALGGGAMWAGGTSDLTGNGVESMLSSMLAGVFFDAFPSPKEGMHLGAMAGYAMHTISDHPSGVERTHGFGGAAWLGYDWWVADEISTGLMLRFNGALTQGEDGAGSLRINSTGLSLLATALYH